MRISSAVMVESPAAAAVLSPLVPHRVVPRLVVSAAVALFADPPRPAPGPDAAAATFAAIGLRDPTALSTLPTGDAPAGPLRVTVRPPTAAAAARAPDCPGHVAEWVAASAAEARRRGVVPAESAEDDVAAVPRFASHLGAGKVVGTALSAAMRARGVRCGAVGCLVVAGVDDAEAALCTTVLVRRFRPAWVCFAGDAEALHRDSFLGCNGDADVFDLSRLRKLKHLPIAQGGYCVQDELRRIVLPRLSAAPFKTNSLFSMHDLQGLHVPWNWRTACLGDSTMCFGHNLVHLDLSYQAGLTNLGQFTFQSCDGLVSACFRGCVNLKKLGWSAFTDCKRLRILDVAECPKLTVDTIAADTFDDCNDLELIIAPPHIDAGETSQRLKTEWKIDNVRVVHWPPSEAEGGDGVLDTPGEGAMPHVYRIVDALEIAHDAFRRTPERDPDEDCEANVLKPALNTEERLPPLGVVPALPADYTADAGDPAPDDDDDQSGRERTEVFEETPTARPARKSCPCCAVLVERYRRMQCAHASSTHRISTGPVGQQGVFGGTTKRIFGRKGAEHDSDDDATADAYEGSHAAPSTFGGEHLQWGRDPDSPSRPSSSASSALSSSSSAASAESSNSQDSDGSGGLDEDMRNLHV